MDDFFLCFAFLPFVTPFVVTTGGAGKNTGAGRHEQLFEVGFFTCASPSEGGLGYLPYMKKTQENEAKRNTSNATLDNGTLFRVKRG